MHDARAHGITETLVTEVTHLGIEGQQSGHECAVTMSRSGMYYLARSLIDDGEVLVVEHDVDRDAGVGFDVGAQGRRQDRHEVLALAHRRRGFHDHLVVQRDRTARDDVTRIRA